MSAGSSLLSHDQSGYTTRCAPSEGVGLRLGTSHSVCGRQVLLLKSEVHELVGEHKLRQRSFLAVVGEVDKQHPPPHQGKRERASCRFTEPKYLRKRESLPTPRTRTTFRN